MKYAARVHTVYTWNICTIWVLGTGLVVLTDWGRVTHICVSKLTIIGLDNGLSPGRRQAIIWTNAGILLIRPRGTNFSEILIGNQTFSFKKMHLMMSSAKWRLFYLGLNVLTDFRRFVRFIHPHSLSLLQWHLENYMIIARASDITEVGVMWIQKGIINAWKSRLTKSIYQPSNNVMPHRTTCFQTSFNLRNLIILHSLYQSN